ncbi:MAG: extracellular solute-binding protein [Chloroflexia bacterium]|nr:extracellular solute-binding protein [Chloroflexia bacterium]
MDRKQNHTPKSATMTRRSALQLAGAAALAAGTVSTTGLSAAAQSTPSPAAPAYPLVLEQGPIKIYDYGLTLPTDDVTFRWADHQGVRVPFHEALHAAFMEAYPNITIEYDSLGQDLAELLAVGVQSGDAHDVLPSNAGILAPQAVREGWIAPLDDVLPNFEQWKAAYPPNTFLPGINVFDGKTYSCPMYASKLHRNLLFYNTGLLRDAGYDPATTPLTWDDFRAAARTVTEQGNYGFISAGGPGSSFVVTLAEIAGAHGGEFNWQTGEFNYTSDQFLAAIDLMMAMNDDGSFLPGMASMTDTDVRARLPQGRAAMYISGIWNVSIWEQAEPGFDFGVASAPVPTSGEAFPLSIAPGIGEAYYLYAGSDYKEIAAALFAFVGSLEGNVALKEISKAVNPAVFPEANEIVDHSERGKRAIEINDQQLRLRPAPAVRNLDATQVEMERRPVTPNLMDVVNGIFSGQVGDPRAAMQDLQDRSNQELDRAIQAAVDSGAQVSRDDWVFSNWDPAEDYDLEKYEEL